MGLFPDLVTFFSSYGSYHHNFVNKMIHLVCIPQILLSALQITNHYSFEIQTPLCTINFAIVFILLLSLVYVQVDFQSGVVASLFYATLTLLANSHYHKLSGADLTHHLYLAWVVHVVCWVLQFIGHGIFEKRAPALLDNLLQVFVAPDFVVIEILFFLGYKPKVYTQCQQKIKEEIAKFQAQKKSK